MKFKKDLGHLLSEYDISRMVDYEFEGVKYKLLPIEKNDIDDENTEKIIKLIKSAKSKPVIAEELGITVTKLDNFLKDTYKTKKITAIRQILLQGLLTYNDLKEEDRVTRRKKKETVNIDN